MLPKDNHGNSTLVAGLGNPIMSDDGVGWVVAKNIQALIGVSPPNLHIESFSLAGISLMEQMIGFQRVVLIDSLNTGMHSQGDVLHFTLDVLTDLTHGHSASAHDLSLKKALIMGRSMNVELPEDKNIHIIAIEASHVYEFGEVLSPQIEASVPIATQKVLLLLKKFNIL
jgi:hydrogenase maturation protease